MADFFDLKRRVHAIVTEAVSDFTITWSFVNRNPPRRWAYLGNLTWPEGEWATNRTREYQMVVPIVLNAIKARATPEAAEEWMAERVNAVTAGFEADSTLRSAGVVTWNIVPRQFGAQPHPDGIEVQAALELQVTYR